jgi:hypothetical protein
VNDAAGAAVEHTADQEKRAANVQVADVHMPVIVGFGRLAKASSFLRRFAIGAIHHAWVTQDAIDARSSVSRCELASLGVIISICIRL